MNSVVRISTGDRLIFILIIHRNENKNQCQLLSPHWMFCIQQVEMLADINRILFNIMCDLITEIIPLENHTPENSLIQGPPYGHYLRMLYVPLKKLPIKILHLGQCYSNTPTPSDPKPSSITRVVSSSLHLIRERSRRFSVVSRSGR